MARALARRPGLVRPVRELLGAEWLLADLEVPLRLPRRRLRGLLDIREDGSCLWPTAGERRVSGVSLVALWLGAYWAAVVLRGGRAVIPQHYQAPVLGHGGLPCA